MLFDLRGRRRRAVQATYLTLAVLMGGGLVLFGIGGNVSGGLFDAFKGGGGSSGDQQARKRVEREQKALARNPRDAAILKALVRDQYQVATSQIPQSATSLPEGSRKTMLQASRYWQRYLAVEKGKRDPAVANIALQMYGALSQPKGALQAATIVAEGNPISANYLNVVRYAALAGDNRTADLAGQKAVELAPKSAKSNIRQQVKQAKQAGKQAAQQSAGQSAGQSGRGTP
jgi:hypothetical protein